MAQEEIVKQEEKTPARAWAVLVVVYIASFMAPMAQFKVPALESWIIPGFIIPQMGDSNIGLYFGIMMSALSIIGVILAFPTAAIVKKLGMKMSMVASVVALALGTLVCAVTGSYWVLLIGRMIEGIGIGLVGVVAPACVSIWFPDKTRGTALGIWASWFPLGITLMFNIAPPIATAWGWKSVYWFCFICDIVALILFLLVFRMPPKMEGAPPEEGTFSEGIKYLKSGKLWLLALAFFCFNFVQLGFLNTYYNQFLTGTVGLTPAAANGMTSVTTAIGIFASPLAGILYDRMPKKAKNVPALICFALFVVSLLFAFHNSLAAIWAFIWIVGIGAGLGAGSLRPYAPSLVPNTAFAVSMAMALLQFMQNAGAALGSPIYGAMNDALGWTGANFALLIPVSVIGFILIALVRPGRESKKAAEEPSDEA